MHFEKNIAVLSSRFPKIAQMVIDSKGYGISLQDLGAGIFDVQGTDSLRYGGQPLEEAKKSVDRLSGSYPKLLIVYGIGLAYHVERFFKVANKITESILLVEKSPALFYHALHRMDWTAILSDKRVSLAVGLEGEGVSEFLREYFFDTDNLVHGRALFPMQDGGFDAAEVQYYVSFAHAVKDAIGEAGHFLLGSVEDSYRGFMNIIRNIPNADGVPSIDPLMGLFKGFPGIAVSTGPSLEKSLPWLREAQDRAVIACTDSSLKVLLKNGIRPHFVACSERVPETKLLFDGVTGVDETWLVTTPVTWPETYGGYPGPKLNMMRPIGQLKWFYPEAQEHFTGSSVSHLLYVMLRELGCDPILLVGQDLAFDRHSTRTHVDGIHSLLYEVGQKQRDTSDKQSVDSQVTIEGNDGNPILSMVWYDEFRKVFGMLLKDAKATCYNVIPKEYGAKIRGAILKDPSEALSLLGPSRDVVSDVRARLMTRPALKGRPYREFMKERIATAVDSLKRYEELSLDVLDAVSAFRQRYSPAYFPESTFRPFLNRIETVTRDLFKHDQEFYWGFFNAQIVELSFMIALDMEALLAHEKDFKRRVELQIENIRSFYNNINTWAGRMRRFLERNADTLFKSRENSSEVRAP